MNITTAIINYDNDGIETTTWHNLDVIADSTLTYHLFLIMGVFLFDLQKWITFLITTDEKIDEQRRDRWIKLNG